MSTITPGQLIPASTINQWCPVGAAVDFRGLVVPSGWFAEDGSAISRTTYSDLLGAITLTQSGTRTNGSPTITGLASTVGLKAGMPVEGTGIPASTTILSVDSSSQITLSANATSTGSNSVTIFPYGNGDGSTTFNLPDSRGRVNVGFAASGGHADVSAYGANDGVSVLFRRPKHRHTPHSHVYTGPSGGNSAPGGALAAPSPNTDNTSSVDGGSGNANDSLDAPAYIVAPRIIRAKDV